MDPRTCADQSASKRLHTAGAIAIADAKALIEAKEPDSSTDGEECTESGRCCPDDSSVSSTAHMEAITHH